MEITIDPEQIIEVQRLLDTLRTIYDGEHYFKLDAKIMERHFLGVDSWSEWWERYPASVDTHEKRSTQ